MVSAGHGFDLHRGLRAVQGEAFAVTAGETGSAMCLSGEGGVLLNSLPHAGKHHLTIVRLTFTHCCIVNSIFLIWTVLFLKTEGSLCPTRRGKSAKSKS